MKIEGEVRKSYIKNKMKFFLGKSRKIGKKILNKNKPKFEKK